MQRAREHRERGEPMLWFRLDGREYVVRDQSVLREAQEIWERWDACAEQGKIGAKQGASARGKDNTVRVREAGAEQG